jgi:4-hydroxy-tetrahydrodipicolinate synthase
MRFEGVYVANVTPFEKTGELSERVLEKHLRWLAENGVQGFVPCGTTGEGSTLTYEERRKVIELALKIASEHKLKVVAGCNSNAPSVILKLIREAKDLGCDAALVVTPYYIRPTPHGLFAHFEYLANEGDFPLLLYNIPSRTGVNLSPDVSARLLRHPKIVGIKEASGQHVQWQSLANQVDLRERSLLAGDDDAFAPILALGGSGIISASANVVPREFVALYDLARQGKWEDAFQMQLRLFPLIRSLFLETNPSPVKRALSSMDRMEETVRLPLVPVEEETAAAIRKALREINP